MLARVRKNNHFCIAAETQSRVTECATAIWHVNCTPNIYPREVKTTSTRMLVYACSRAVSLVMVRTGNKQASLDRWMVKQTTVTRGLTMGRVLRNVSSGDFIVLQTSGCPYTNLDGPACYTPGSLGWPLTPRRQTCTARRCAGCCRQLWHSGESLCI